MYIIEAMVENFITILTSGAFLATLTKHLGVSDSMTAILSSITALSGLFQIIAVFVAHKTPVKRWVVPLQLLTHLLLCGLYLIPVIGFEKHASLLFFIFIIGANAIKSIKSSVKINWFYSMVKLENQGNFSAILTAVSVVGAIFFSLGASFVFDSFIDAGNTRGAFTVITVTILVLIVLDIIPLILSKEKAESRKRAPSPFSSLKGILSNPNFRILLILGVTQSLASGIAPPFLSTYQINELGFSLSFIAIIDTVVNIVWVCALLIFGKVSKSLPYATIMHISAFIHAISYAILIFVMPGNGMITFTLYRIFMIIQGSASAVSSRSLLFELVEPDNRASALAIYTMLTGVFSFLITLSVTPIFNSLQLSPIVLFGIELYAQQALAIASFAIMLVVNILWTVFSHRLCIKHQ